MKQILITRHQLDEVIAIENGKLASRIAMEEKNFQLGMAYVHYVCELSEMILNHLFGEPDDQDFDTLCKWCDESKEKFLKILEEGDSDGK